MQINFNDFSGGIVPSFDSTKPFQNSYPMLSNGRTRNNTIFGIKKPKKLNLPAGKKQGIYALDKYLIVFVSGKAWYWDTTLPENYVQLSLFSMSDVVDTIYMQPVPSSTLNFRRKSQYETNSVVVSSVPISTSAAGGLCMDGETQDWIIFPTAAGLSCRKTQTYEQWRLTQYTGGETQGGYGDAQEYVPIGVYPLWTGQRLRKAGKDSAGRYTKILSSVSGRPLDFGVWVAKDGQIAGTADAIAHAVAYEELRGLFPIPDQELAYVACTATRTFAVISDTSQLFWGEAFPRTLPLFNSGAIGPFASTDVNGELTIISATAINGVGSGAKDVAKSSLKRLSENRTFSAPISDALTKTTYGVATRFDDYALYAMNTILGPSVVVYDLNSSVFISIDRWAGVGEIKMFATTATLFDTQLFFYDSLGNGYQAYGADEYEVTRFYIGDINSQSGFTKHVVNDVALTFTQVRDNFPVTIDIYKDKIVAGSHARLITGSEPFLQSITPFEEPREPLVKGIVLSVADTSEAFSSGVLISWAGSAHLSTITLQFTESDSQFIAEAVTPSVTTMGVLADVSAEAEVLIQKDGCAPVTNKVLDVVINKLSALDATIGVGNITPPTGSYQDWIDIAPYFSRVKNFIAVPGNLELDNESGKVFYNFPGRGQSYRVEKVSPLLSVFLLNSGYTSGQATPNDVVPFAEYAGNDTNSVQMRWLKYNLERSTSVFNVIAIHHPPYTIDNSTHGYPRLRIPFKSYGAHLVISAHSKAYERWIVDDLPYVVTGTSGASLSTMTGTDEKLVKRYTANHGYGKLTAGHHKLLWEYFSVDGTQIDKYTINL